jgi:ABC-type multidrug transport system fused ATPase/permease subunit
VSTDVPEQATNADDAAAASAPTAAYASEVLRELMAILRRESAVRAQLEEEITGEHDAEVTRVVEEATKALAAIRTKYESEIESSRREYASVLAKADAFLAAEQKKLIDLRDTKAKSINGHCSRVLAELHDDEGFDKLREGESRKTRGQQPKIAAAKAEKELARGLAQLDEAVAQSTRFLVAHGVKDPPTATEVPSGADALDPGEAPLAAVAAAGGAALEQATAIHETPDVKRAFSGGLQGAVIAGPIVASLALAIGAFFLMPGSMGLKAGAAGGAAVVILAAGLGAGLGYVRSRRRAACGEMLMLHQTLLETVAAGKQLEPACHAWIRRRQEDQTKRLEELFREESDKRATEYDEKRKAATDQRDQQLAELDAKYQESSQKLAVKVADHKAAADKKYPPRIEALEATLRERIGKREQERDDLLAAARARRNERWAAMTARWKEAREGTAAIYDAASWLDAESFRPWDELAREDVPLPTEPPPGLRFGDLSLSLERVPGGVSAVPELNAFGPIAWTQPATLPWPVAASLMIKASPDDKEISSAMMQAVMLRIATGIPAGQSRFTIIDPLGLGKQYAGFMHLADHDELLVTSRIWTEPQLIEQKLADITEQMEVVIQKYLRNEYSSIGAYNADAEVPEPYRFVVVANFPFNFNETSARRLASIASSGARCGVYVIMSVDPKQQMPSGFSLADVEQHSTVVKLDKGRFTWVDPEFSKWPLTVEHAPPDETFTKIIQRVGRGAKAAKRIVVPFDRVAPKIEDWWKGSTAEEVLAPLGPAGAKKLQYLKLGKGTSQHLLIAGKTGSGKSTLMHAMITSLALQYSPNEIQFYLIDFKKGVEFKLYDHYALPHARVIAIESEREFGLSVMEQLDRELKRRGDLFRELSVQNVAGFRQTGHPDPMPRILLLIDEFQEIFVEDDKIAQDASLILDRLVRQGRAFGIHVLLGSQTLGGSYSLPRATMGQMAVRIALQCNEADSSLILSDENTAARLLTRPGEAIYNDANGMVEGNNPFQVVFLTDEQREQYLGDLRKLADRRTDIPHLERIVFDGNQAADPALNPLLTEMLDKGTVQGHELLAPLAWLGDAIAIKDPTAAIFRRQGGANMLIAGQREDLGTSLLAMSIVSLAAEHDPHPGGALGRVARFVILEPAIAEEKPEIMLARLAEHLPHDIEVAGRLGVASAMESLANEVKRRLDEQVLDGEAVFLVIRDLGRFRELRKADGDFGFGGFGSEKKAGPGDNLLTVLRDGPPVGIHLITWCDSLTNLQRTFDRGAIKEFELRVLFQMSSSDSSTLVDTPIAAKLGPNRGLFIHEETGTLEKFRPYSFPSPGWLAEVSAKMRARPQGTPTQPQGTPASRPVAKADEPPASGKPSGFSFSGGGDFNFTKLLDDAPGDAASDPIAEPPQEG